MALLPKLLLLVAVGHVGCLPHTSYVPKPGKAALAMKKGRLAIVKDGDVAERDRFEVVMTCEPAAATLARTASENFVAAERDQQIAGIFNALVIVFPLAPLIGLPWTMKAVREDQDARAAIVDAINRHNDAPICVRASGPGSVIGAGR